MTFPLATVDPGPDDADLTPWSDGLDGVRIVGLGEATHGTREFFTLKHRLIRHLVEERGTRTVAFEASEAAAVAVDACVRDGVGDVDTVLAGLGFWVWHTVEVRDLLVWLRSHNAGLSPERRVRFVGVDPQLPTASVEAVTPRLAALGRPDLAGALGPLAGRGARGASLSPATLAAARAAAELVPGPASAHLVRSAELATAGAHGRSVSAVRDRLMAEAVTAVADACPDDGPVAVWAHNGHLRVLDGLLPMGSRLRHRWGAAYYALGLTFGEGGFRARRSWARRRPPVAHRVGAAPPTAIESEFAGDVLVDLRDATWASWGSAPSWTRSFGAVAPAFPRLAFTPITPSAEFDGLAHVASATPSAPCERNSSL